MAHIEQHRSATTRATDADDGRASGRTLRLSPDIVALGCVSLLMGMSSAMIYGLLPVFLVTVLGASMTSIGIIEGMAEATTSLTKIFSGAISDWLGRRRPLVLIGYGLSAVNKLLFPLAAAASTVLIARVVDRVGKGIRDAPRDALLADVTPARIRGSGFGLRLALYTVGAVAGPLTAMGLMALTGNDFRLVFWVAVVPAFASVLVLYLFVREPPRAQAATQRRSALHRADLARLALPLWWIIAVAAVLSLARFSPAFLVLKAHAVDVAPGRVPMVLVFMYLVYSAAAYPFGRLADGFDRRMQLALGASLLVAANLVLGLADTFWLTAIGAGLWGLQMGVTQGLLSAAVADAAPEHLRGTAFGIYDLAIGLTTLCASAGAGALWALGGPALVFGAGGSLAAVAVMLLLLRPLEGATAA